MADRSVAEALPRLGFVGLWLMGSSFALNLIRVGYPVTVTDLSRERAGPHLDAGARWADSPRAVAEAADIVLLSLPGPPEVEAVALDPGSGLIAGLPEQVLVNTCDPPSFQLRQAHKDVSLACQLGREHGVPMRLINMTLEEMTEARNRGWDALDSRSMLRLQLERAGVSIEEDPADVRAVLDADRPAAG